MQRVDEAKPHRSQRDFAKIGPYSTPKIPITADLATRHTEKYFNDPLGWFGDREGPWGINSKETFNLMAIREVPLSDVIDKEVNRPSLREMTARRWVLPPPGGGSPPTCRPWRKQTRSWGSSERQRTWLTNAGAE